MRNFEIFRTDQEYVFVERRVHRPRNPPQEQTDRKTSRQNRDIETETETETELCLSSLSLRSRSPVFMNNSVEPPKAMAHRKGLTPLVASRMRTGCLPFRGSGERRPSMTMELLKSEPRGKTARSLAKAFKQKKSEFLIGHQKVVESH